MTHPLDEAKREIVDAISEIMEKYNLKLTIKDYDSLEYWYLESTIDRTNMADVLSELLPIEYGKVKK